MSQTYLDKFRSALPTTQGKQILKLLISKRDSGEIRTIDEFKNKLKELTAELLAERITPTLKLFNAIPGVDTSSEQYNEMLERIEDDLEAAFAEADNLDEIIEQHHNLINQIALKSLRFGINELESKISLYEFLNKNSKGFDDALFNTFRESSNHFTSRTDKSASLVYVDPRRNARIDEEDAHVDLIGERLILGAKNINYLSPKKAVWLANSESIRSELNVEFANSRISNIVDGLKNTYWVVPILLSRIRPTGAPLEVNITLNASQDVNFVEIEPASEFPMVLTGIDYFNSNNNRETLGVSEALIKTPTRINFERITATSVVLKFRQDNYKEIQFTQKPGESNFHKAVLGQGNVPVNIESISEDLREVLSSDFILSDIMGVPPVSTAGNKYFEYILGFDNIRLGFNTFQERSVFVSKQKKVDAPGQLALRVSEVRPTQSSDSANTTIQSFNYPQRSTAEDNKFYHGSIEYWVLMQLFGEDDFLISTDTIPVLPLGAKRVYHEQLIFFKKSTALLANPDMASFMFFADDDSDDVCVYRNGSLLNYSTDGTTGGWEFVGPDTGAGLPLFDDEEITFATPNAGARMKRGIRILGLVNPLDVYTVSYTPQVSNTPVVFSDTRLLKLTDLVGDQSVRSMTDNVVILETARNSHKIVRGEFYLTIIMRRNSANINFSPAVEEYMLITGSRNDQKFVGE